jgi:hypothetical protein
VRNTSLYAALRAYAEEAATALAAETANGADVPFEVREHGGSRRSGRPALYCYRPLTDRFIASRDLLLLRLESAPGARRALGRLDGLGAYVPKDGDPVGAALRRLLEEVFADSTHFEFSAERFDRAYGVLEQTVYADRSLVTVAVPVLGLELEADEMVLGEDLWLVPAGARDDLPAEAGGEDAVVAIFEGEERAGEPSTVATARWRLRRLVTALRLFDVVAPALGPVGWLRRDGGEWRLSAVGGAGRPRGVLVLPAAQEDELRAFVALVARRIPRGGEVAWALARYEMGCERLGPLEALTDHLLALRALLEPEGPESGRLAPRLAALCAQPLDRPELAARMSHAAALERAIVAGVLPPSADAEGLVEEVARHTRALLRDTLCGHLDSDVRALADELLGEAAVPA